MALDGRADEDVMSSRGIAAALAACTALSVTASAQAAPVVVGSPLTASFTQTTTHYVGTATNTALPESGALVASPVTGAVRRWRLQATGAHRLRILRKNADGTYTGIATSAPGTGSGAQTATFDTVLPIRAGDLIGIDDSSTTDTIGIASVPGAAYSVWIPGLADGATSAPTSSVPGGEFAFNADVVPAPAVSAVSPASGAAGSDTPVVITGSDFTDASAVSFGGTDATTFSVDSANQITAVVPAGAAGDLDVRVTTPSGVSAVTAVGRFARVAPADVATTATQPAAPAALLPAPIAPIGEPRATATGVTMTISCEGPAGGACQVAARLVVAVIRRHGSHRIVRAAAVTKAKRAYRAYRAYLTVGARKAKIATGQQATMTVTLNRTGRALLRRAKRLKLRVARAYSAPNGAKWTRLPTRRVVLKRR
jgi:hypothetical protein